MRQYNADSIVVVFDRASHGTVYSPTHQALAPRVLEALQRVHDLGIRHNDLHEGNILVTREHAVFLLDFDKCNLAPYEGFLAAERHEWSYLLNFRPQARMLPPHSR